MGTAGEALATTIFPLTAPRTVGLKVTVRLAACPEAISRPATIPDEVKPAPLTVTAEM